MMEITALIRMLLVFGLSLIFGLERQRSHKPVGFGTFIFVALGACTIGIVATKYSLGDSISLLAATITGIGFLGAGALIKNTDKVFGFTTASAIWLFAIFGLVFGIGEYLIGMIAYALVWIVILFDNYLEIRGIGSYKKKIVISANKMSQKTITDYIMKYTKNHKLLHVKANKKDHMLTLTYFIEGNKENVNRLIHDIFKEEWLASCEIE